MGHDVDRRKTAAKGREKPENEMIEMNLMAYFVVSLGLVSFMKDIVPSK